ncbi:hypothetical protein SO802_006880 [Lithocarpus litseifolius]|uniref:Replication factor A C-terminal domain-containing protein n=1 Tax=Lithocarpus litseifolius TaxID=425828 RepID=A0AAW2DMI3_9ROSI
MIQIHTNMEYTTLKQISSDKDNSKVKVGVLRMWDAINIANNHDLISFDMILVDKEDLLVTCNAKIININNKYGWYYVACLICKTKVKQIKGVLWCERCKNEPKFAVPSYRIQVQVQDETSVTTFTLFDKGAKKIISKTAKELAEQQEEDTMEEIVRKSRKDKYIASQNIEIGETSIERPELTTPTTTEDGRTGHKKMSLQMLQKRQKGFDVLAALN